MKKILIVANVAKEHVIKFHTPTIKMLKDNGWLVHVACSGDEEIPYCDKQFKMPYDRSPFGLGTIRAIPQLKRIIESEKYDIVHCHTPTGGLVARVSALSARRKFKTRIIYTAHGLHFFKGAPLLNWLLFFPVEWILSFMTDEIVLINQEDYDNVRRLKFGAKSIKKINGMGVNNKKFKLTNGNLIRLNYRKQLGFSDSDLVLIYVAELIPNKNQSVLIDALRIVKEQIPNTKLVLVGPDHNDGKFQKQVYEMGLNDSVIFTGWRSDIPELLNMADICVASSKREGLGLNIIEAMFSGLPVVASDNRGHRDIIINGKNGFLVDADKPSKYASAIIKLYGDNMLKSGFIEEAFAGAEKYSQRNVNKEIKKMYFDKQELIANY